MKRLWGSETRFPSCGGRVAHMNQHGKRPVRWWNAVVAIRVPFDTPEEARDAFTDDETIDRLFDIFGNNATIGGTVEEAVEGVWPF